MIALQHKILTPLQRMVRFLLHSSRRFIDYFFASAGSGGLAPVDLCDAAHAGRVAAKTLVHSYFGFKTEALPLPGVES